MQVQTTDLKEKFPNAHCVQLVSVAKGTAFCFALVNVWKTDAYKSIEQVVICIQEANIKDVYSIHNPEKHTRWLCIYALDNSNYWLGSSYSSMHSGATLSLFSKNTLLKSRSYDQGHDSEIIKLEKTKRDDILIEGNWYRCIRAGGHDEFWPEKWEATISNEGADIPEENNALRTQDYFPISISDCNSNCFFVIENFGISKYTITGEMLWNKGLGGIGNEKLMPLTYMAPYNTFEKKIASSDGVWFAGLDYKNSDRYLGEALFGRITSAGHIFSLSYLFNDYPEVFKIHALVSGNNSNCLLIGETLHVGKGSGLFILHIQYSNNEYSKKIRYLNFSTDDLQLSISNKPVFEERYVDIKGVFPQHSNLEELNEIIILGNVTHLRNRDNGMIWSIQLEDTF